MATFRVSFELYPGECGDVDPETVAEWTRIALGRKVLADDQPGAVVPLPCAGFGNVQVEAPVADRVVGVGAPVAGRPR